ncbi:MAG: hypothetical protein Q8O92_09645 [Candidatus Latescibacter sp.]|nr:hypothetical protein [Candidatus Latescibacter sp.]
MVEMDNDDGRSMLATFLVPTALMVIVYLAVTGGANFLTLLAVRSGFVTFHTHGHWISNLLRNTFTVLFGLLAIRVIGLSRAEIGLTFSRERSYIPHALVIGAAAGAMLTALIFLPALLHGLQTPPAHVPKLPAGSPPVPAIWEQALIFGVQGIVQAFLFFGIVQAYLMRKSMAHVRLGPWELPTAGIAVCIVAACNFLPWFRGSQLRMAFTMMVLAPLAFQSLVLLASSFWFERSRCLAAPMLAFGMYYGVIPVFWRIMFNAVS